MTSQTDPRVVAHLGRFSAFTSLFAVGVGVVGLTGWILHIQALKTIFRGQVAVKANTTICFILLGLAFWLVRREAETHTLARKLTSSCAALVVSVVGLLSVLEWFYGWQLGIDLLLFPETVTEAAGSIRPGLMSPITGFGFMLLGPTIVFLDWTTKCCRWPAQILAGLVAIAAIFGLFDLLLDPYTTHTHIAPTTAFTLFLFSCGLICARTKWGIGALLASAGAGGSMARRMMPASIMAPIVIAWLGWRGTEAGAISHWAGIACMAVSATALLAGLTAWTAAAINHSERERKRVEEALLRSNTRRAFALETAKLGDWELDLNTLEATRSLLHDQIFGYESLLPEWNFDIFLHHVHPDDRERVRENFEASVGKQKRWEFECRIISAKGDLRWIWACGDRYQDLSSGATRMFGIVEDITERRRAEEAIQSLNEKLATANLELETRVRERTSEWQRATAEALRRGRILDAINRVLQETLTAGSEEDLAQNCLAVAQDLTGSVMGVIDEINPAGLIDSIAVSIEGWSACKIPETEKFLMLKNLHVRGLWAPVVLEGQSRIVNDPLHDPNRVGIPTGHPAITCFMGVPLKDQGKTIGFIGLGNKPGNFDEADQQAVESLSSPIVEALRRKRAENEIQKRTAELVAANQELEAFTYSVSHDLRAPLRHISGFSKLLTEEFGPTLPPDAQRHLQRIQDGTRHMGMLVDDLLNLARVGRRGLSLQVSGLKSVVDEVLVELAPEYEGRKIEWKIGNLPFVECDPGLVKLIFQNLLSNAIKFTRPRTKAIIEIGQQNVNKSPVIFVRDNGVGFSMKYADKLFGVFQRLHRTEDFEGTGVGLATVQRIIQKHGGRIWAEAELDQGATFYFTLGNSRANGSKAKAATGGDKQ